NSDLTNIKISDNIKALDKKEHTYELRFHLDPSIKAEIVSDSSGKKSIQLFRGNILIGQVKVDKGDLSIINDVYFPYYYAKPETTDVVHIKLRAKDTSIETNIELK